MILIAVDSLIFFLLIEKLHATNFACERRGLPRMLDVANCLHRAPDKKSEAKCSCPAVLVKSRAYCAHDILDRSA